MYLDPLGDLAETVRLAPATPAFEQAFSGFARGAILRTKMGPCAIEDVLPGDEIETATGWATLKWKGAMLIVPGAGQDMPLIRVGAESLGFTRPQIDVVLGPNARMLHRSPGIKRLTGQAAAFALARESCDGVSIVETRPVSPVQVFHLGFDQHEVLNVGGLEVESYHPGPEVFATMRGDLLDLFMSMFPHKSDVSDFGKLTLPRISLKDLDIFNAA